MRIDLFAIVSQRVLLERKRQEHLKETGRFKYTLDDNPGMDDGQRLAALLEEVAEVGKAILGEAGLVIDGGDIDKELTQVAALAFAWLEGRMDARN